MIHVKQSISKRGDQCFGWLPGEYVGTKLWNAIENIRFLSLPTSFAQKQTTHKQNISAVIRNHTSLREC